MKKRTRRVLHVDKEFNSTRCSSSHLHSVLNESSRLPTSTSKRTLAPPTTHSSSPLRRPVERPISKDTPAIRLSRRQALDAVLPRPNSPDSSLHLDSDEEMKSILLEVTEIIESCSISHIKKVRSSSSDKGLGRLQTRGRRRVLPPVGAGNQTGEIGRYQSSGVLSRQQVSTPSYTADDSSDGQQSVLAEYLGEVRKMKQLKQNFSRGLLDDIDRPGKKLRLQSRQSQSSSHSKDSLQPHTTGCVPNRTIKGAIQKFKKQHIHAKDYLNRIQDAIHELDNSLDRYPVH